MHMTSSLHHYMHCMGLASLQIQNSNNVDVLLDGGLNLFDIIANLYDVMKCCWSQEIILWIYQSWLLCLELE